MNGEFVDTCMGRTINPGHCIETSWFILDVAKQRGWDKEITDMALQIFDWSWDWGWDKQYGGIINFRDCRNLPVQDYSQDMKSGGHRPKPSSLLSMLTLQQVMTSISTSISASASGPMLTSRMPSSASVWLSSQRRYRGTACQG